MKAVAELKSSTSLSELLDEYNQRVELKKQMVGTLYPDIVTNEMYAIDERFSEISKICEQNKKYLLEKWKIS